MSKKNGIMKLTKWATERMLKEDANQTTCSIFFQPKAPQGLEKYKKQNEARR